MFRGAVPVTDTGHAAPSCPARARCIIPKRAAGCESVKERPREHIDKAGHIVVMHQGRLLGQGTPEKVRANAQVQEAYLGGQHVAA